MKIVIAGMALLMLVLVITPLFRAQSTSSRLVWETVDCVSAMCVTDPRSVSKCEEILPVLAYISIQESLENLNKVRVDIRLTDKSCD